MHEITTEEITFYCLVWIVAFAASLLRAIRDNESRTAWHGIALGCTAGFVSFGVVSIWLNSDTAGDALPWYWLGVSALIGLLGKEQDNIMRLVIQSVLKGVKQAIDDQTKDKQ